MGNKFNLDQLRASTATSDAPGGKFKRTADIFSKVESQVENLETDRLLEFKGHPFKVTENEQFAELVESVQAEGILSPLIVRVHPEQKGYYEILAGHRRQRAAVKAELATVPCIIQNVDDDTAKLIVVGGDNSEKLCGYASVGDGAVAENGIRRFKIPRETDGFTAGTGTNIIAF